MENLLQKSNIVKRDYLYIRERCRKNKRYNFTHSLGFEDCDYTNESVISTILVLLNLYHEVDSNLWVSYYIFTYLERIINRKVHKQICLSFDDFAHYLLYECMLRRKSFNKDRLMPLLLKITKFIRDNRTSCYSSQTKDML